MTSDICIVVKRRIKTQKTYLIRLSQVGELRVKKNASLKIPNSGEREGSLHVFSSFSYKLLGVWYVEPSVKSGIMSSGVIEK